MTTLCLAIALYFEAGNQDMLGRIAVAQVILNRVESSRYPNTVCDVIKQRKQFSFYSDGKPDYELADRLSSARWRECELLAERVLSGKWKFPDLVKGATHYHATYVEPYWTSVRLVWGKVIQDHVFYRI